MLFAMGTGILMAFTVLIVIARLGMRKFMGYPAVLDASIVIVLGWLLHGTFGGITAAITGGLFFSLMITVIRKYYGYSRLTHRGWVTNYGVFGKPATNWREVCSKLLASKALLPCIALLLIFLSVL